MQEKEGETPIVCAALRRLEVLKEWFASGRRDPNARYCFCTSESRNELVNYPERVNFPISEADRSLIGKSTITVATTPGTPGLTPGTQGPKPEAPMDAISAVGPGPGRPAGRPAGRRRRRRRRRLTRARGEKRGVEVHVIVEEVLEQLHEAA